MAHMSNATPAPDSQIPKLPPRRSSLRCVGNSASLGSDGQNGDSAVKSPSPRPSSRKSVSFATFGSDRKVRTVGECVDNLRGGIALLKIKPNGRVYRRLFFIDDQAMELRWSPTKKSKAKLPLASIREICIGRSTDSLRSNATAMTYNDCQFFSIIHGAELNCLDLIASTPEDATTCVSALRSIIATLTRRQSLLSQGSMSSTQGGECGSVYSASANIDPSSIRTGWLASLCSDEPTVSRVSATSSNGSSLDQNLLGRNIIRSSVSEETEGSEACASESTRQGSDSSSSSTVASVQRLMIPRDKVLSLIQQINPASSMTFAEIRLKELLRGRTEMSFNEFVQIVDDVAIWQEIHFLLVNKSTIGGGQYMTLDDIQRFLECEQEEPCPADAHSIIDKFEPNPLAKASNLIGCEGFQRYLLSEGGCAFAQNTCTSVNNPEFANDPFTNYFVFAFSRCFGSSDCGLDPVDHYVSVLRSGCKYVELCLHDYSGHDVCVCHAASGRAPLSSALNAILRNAFTRSKHPLIIHISAFCSPDVQRRAASLIKSTFGNAIAVIRPLVSESNAKLASSAPHTTSPGGHDYAVFSRIPTLAELEGRVILTSDNADSSDVVSAAPHLGASPRSLVADLAEFISYQFIFCTPAGGNSKGVTGVSSSNTTNVSSIPLALIDSCGSDFSSFRQCVCSSATIASAARTSFIRVTLLDSPALMAANSRLAIDMSGCPGAINCPPTSPIDSALSPSATHHHTVVPFHYWLTGCQIVAGPARPTSLIRQVAAALFADPLVYAESGAKRETWASVGYMRRSSFVTSLLPVGVDRLSLDLYPGCPPHVVSVEVLAAHNLPRPSRSDAVKADSVDPYVVAELHSLPVDTARGRTRTRPGDSFGPVFVGDKFEFTVRVPQLAVLRFAILDDEFIGDDFIAHTALPGASLRRGYRSLPLYSAEGRRIPACWLIVRIGILESPLPLDLFISQPVPPRRPQTGARSGSSSTTSTNASSLPGKLRTVGVREADDLTRAAANVLAEARALHERVILSFNAARSLLGLPRTSTLLRCLVVLSFHDVSVSLVSTTGGGISKGEWTALRFEPAGSTSTAGDGGGGQKTSSSQSCTDAVRKLLAAFRTLVDDLDTAARQGLDLSRRLALDASQHIAVANALPVDSQAADLLMHNAVLLSTEGNVAEFLAKNCQEMLAKAVTHIRHVQCCNTPTASQR